jgi:hypothetical protein
MGRRLEYLFGDAQHPPFPGLACDPPHLGFTHREYDEVLHTKGTIVALDDMAHHSFFFRWLEGVARRDSLDLEVVGNPAATFSHLHSGGSRVRQ